MILVSPQSPRILCTIANRLSIFYYCCLSVITKFFIRPWKNWTNHIYEKIECIKEMMMWSNPLKIAGLSFSILSQHPVVIYIFTLKQFCIGHSYFWMKKALQSIWTLKKGYKGDKVTLNSLPQFTSPLANIYHHQIFSPLQDGQKQSTNNSDSTLGHRNVLMSSLHLF